MILQGNSIRIPLADNSVHAVCTSPPYWNLRDYSTGKWVGGSGECDHKVRPTHNVASSTLDGGKQTTGHWQEGYKDTCLKCGATRIDNQIGLEPTIAAYIAVIVQVFREVRRVLRPDGVVFCNLGDSYSGGKNGRSAADTKAVGKDDRTFRDKPFSVTELPAKNLCMIPARVAIALQEDGWILRSAIPWIKSNPMPESVRDRPGTAHEHVFMLVKSARYYFDMMAVRRSALQPSGKPELTGQHKRAVLQQLNGSTLGTNQGAPSRALRTSDSFFDSLDAYIAHLQDVRDNGGMLVDSEGMPAALVVNTESYAQAHYATFPRKLISPLIKTTPEKCCPKCSAPWVRVVELVGGVTTGRHKDQARRAQEHGKFGGHHSEGVPLNNLIAAHKTTGWQPTCKCNLAESECVGAIICDPFAGSGTVGAVCREHGRRFIGIDLSAEYLAENALVRSEKKTSRKSLEQLPMFSKPA